MHGLNMYDYSARHFDAAIGKFTTIYSLAEKKPWLTPYHFCSNNPINRIDIGGLYDISKLIANKHYGVIAVFPKSMDRRLRDDYKTAVDEVVETILVESISDYANAMAKMREDGISTDGYTLNSHGNEGFFILGINMKGMKEV